MSAEGQRFGQHFRVVRNYINSRPDQFDCDEAMSILGPHMPSELADAIVGVFAILALPKPDHTALIAKLEQAQVYLIDQEEESSDLHACIHAEFAVDEAITALRGDETREKHDNGCINCCPKEER